MAAFLLLAADRLELFKKGGVAPAHERHVHCNFIHAAAHLTFDSVRLCRFRHQSHRFGQKQISQVPIAGAGCLGPTSSGQVSIGHILLYHAMTVEVGSVQGNGMAHDLNPSLPLAVEDPGYFVQLAVEIVGILA